MSYTVVWEPNAVNALAAIWLHASDRETVTRAQARIDELLEQNPVGMGTVLTEDLFAIEAHPLRAQFEVYSDDYRVSVVSVGFLVSHRSE